MKFNSYLLMISFRQLISRKRQTILTTLGIGVGVMVLITAISLMDGLLQSFIQKIVDNTPHIIVKSEKITPYIPDLLLDEKKGVYVNLIKNVEREDDDVIKNYQGVCEQIKLDKEIDLISPIVGLNEIGKFGTITLPLRIMGIIPALEDKIVKFSSNMTEGNFSELQKTPDGIIVGTSLAKDMNLRLNDRIQITSAKGELYGVKIVGVFSTGLNEVDNNCFINLQLAQNIGNYMKDEVTELYIRVNNLAVNTSLARGIEKRTNYKATTWEENAQGFLSLFKMITMIVYFLTFFVILVAGFSVANVLITNVLEKYRDIAIMKSIGFKKSEVTFIYVFQGLFVALIGAAIGCVLGFVLIEILSSIPTQGSKTGTLRSDRLLMGKSLWYYLIGGGFSIIVSFFASLGPSRNAAKVNPIEILRGER